LQRRSPLGLATHKAFELPHHVNVWLVGEIEEADRTYRPSPPTFD